MNRSKHVSLIEGKDKPIVVRHAERVATWDALRPNGFGWQRARLEPYLSGSNFRFVPFHMPLGMWRPFHITPGTELFVFVLEGQMDWGIGPDAKSVEWFRLGKYDSLFVPNGFGTDYGNSGESDCKYLCGFTRLGEEFPSNVIWTIPGEETPYDRNLPVWDKEAEGK